MYIRVGLLQYIIDLCIRKHSGSAAPRGPPVIAQHLVYCIGLQLAIRVHALGAFPLADVRVHAAPFFVALT